MQVDTGVIGSPRACRTCPPSCGDRVRGGKQGGGGGGGDTEVAKSSHLVIQRLAIWDRVMGLTKSARGAPRSHE